MIRMVFLPSAVPRDSKIHGGACGGAQPRSLAPEPGLRAPPRASSYETAAAGSHMQHSISYFPLPFHRRSRKAKNKKVLLRRRIRRNTAAVMTKMDRTPSGSTGGFPLWEFQLTA